MVNSDKYMIIVDAQNDFVTGDLAPKEAKDVLARIVTKIKTFDGNIRLTRDTHYDNYLDTQEGKKLPVEHAQYGSEGWCVVKEIRDVCKGKKIQYIDKNTFGVKNWGDYIIDPSVIEIVGFCSDICVLANAVLLKTLFPEADIIVYDNLTAGTTQKKHRAAMEVMESLQINVKTIFD